MRIRDDVRFPLELRNTSIGDLTVETVSISQVALGLIPITINAMTTGAYASSTQVQLLANAIAEISKLAKQ